MTAPTLVATPDPEPRGHLTWSTTLMTGQPRPPCWPPQTASSSTVVVTTRGTWTGRWQR